MEYIHHIVFKGTDYPVFVGGGYTKLTVVGIRTNYSN